MDSETSQRPEDDYEAECERLDGILSSHVAQLMEHFDSVSITITKHVVEDDRTLARSRGDGNWYARFASVKEWVVKQEELMRMEQRSAD